MVVTRETHDAAGHKSGQGRANGRAKAETAASDPHGGLPPGVIRQVTAKRGADGDAQLPIEGSEQVVIQKVTIDAHVVQFRHVSALPGEHHFSGSVVDARGRQAHFVTSTHRIPKKSCHFLHTISTNT